MLGHISMFPRDVGVQGEKNCTLHTPLCARDWARCPVGASWNAHGHLAGSGLSLRCRFGNPET